VCQPEINEYDDDDEGDACEKYRQSLAANGILLCGENQSKAITANQENCAAGKVREGRAWKGQKGKREDRSVDHRIPPIPGSTTELCSARNSGIGECLHSLSASRSCSFSNSVPERVLKRLPDTRS